MWAKSSTRDADAQLMLRMPLFEGGKKFALLRKARYAKEAAEYDLDADLEQLRTQHHGILEPGRRPGQAPAWNWSGRWTTPPRSLSIVEEKLRVGRGTVLDRLEAEEIVAEHRCHPAGKAHGTGPGPRRPAGKPRCAGRPPL